jgi:hypothetical protein
MKSMNSNRLILKNRNSSRIQIIHKFYNFGAGRNKRSDPLIRAFLRLGVQIGGYLPEK